MFYKTSFIYFVILMGLWVYQSETKCSKRPRRTTTLEPCHDNWIRIDAKCYYVEKKIMNFTESDAFCKSFGASLIVLKNADVFLALSNTFCVDIGWCDTYINVRASAPLEFVWSDGTPLPRDSTWWRTDEPNNGYSPDFKEGCALMTLSNTNLKPRIADVQCDNMYFPLCEK